MRKGIFNEKQKKLNFLIIISVLSLALLAISPAYGSELNSSSSSHPFLKPILTSTTREIGFSKLVLVSDENEGPFQEIEQYVDLVYIFGGIGAAILILLIYRYMVSKEQKIIKNPPKELYPHKIWKIPGLEEINQEKFDVKRTRLFIIIPAAFIALAELLIFTGRMKFAIWIHIGVLIALSLSNMYVKDLKVYRVYQALMLLPILRLVNLSMPIFFATTLYTFVFVYAPLLIPLAIIITYQQYSFEQVGITTKNLLSYMILCIPLGFLLGLGEYLIIRPDHLIPDLSIINLIKLTFIMVFFVGLTEELIFRSILQVRLSEALSSREALIITCILFGFMHSGYGNFHEILYTGFVALFIGFAFYKTRSLPFVAVLHGFINVFLFGILPYYLKGWTGF